MFDCFFTRPLEAVWCMFGGLQVPLGEVSRGRGNEGGGGI